MGKLIMFLTMLTLGLTGCSVDAPVVNPSGDVIKPIVRPSGESTGNKFVLGDDFQILKYMTNDENYMVSPFSLKMAMMLAANGAEGDTQKEILDVFGIENLDEYNEYAKGLIEKYNSTKSVKLNVANSIWLNQDEAGKDIEFTDAYKDIIEKYYYGKADEEKADKISKKINDWIEEKTNNKIQNMLDESKRAEFLAVLVNTIYFKGEWAEQFEEYATNKEIFTSNDSSKKKIDFMHKTEMYRFYEDENMKMVRVPYKGNDTAMYFVLPTNEDKMDIKSALDNMEFYKVRLSIPKFKTEYKLSFKDILMDLGINKAFDELSAEFKGKMFEGVLPEENVYVDDVLQKTFIEVDEKGTEAAAATAVVLEKNASIAPGQEIIKEFKADRPFIYFIMDENTKEVLFIGEYAYAN